MASRPPQQPQRRSHPTQPNQDVQFEEGRRSESQAPSTTSVDSQTILLNRSSTSSGSQLNEEAISSTQTEQKANTANSAANTSDEVRKCWICFSDETEDTPQSSAWRNPCPCALTAHESCLLDWIADIESPDARSTAAPVEIRCPQCKSQIYLTRPRSVLLEAVGRLEKYASKLLLPGAAAGTLYTLILVFSHHGAHTIRTIFNENDAEVILATRTWGEMNWLEREALRRFPSVFKPFFREWRGLRVEIGLPLIPAALIASRTTLADAVLPILPVMFFATHAPSSRTLSLEYWPPSAALTLVALPYIRSAYDEYLERVWGELERGWIKEVKPRLGERDGNGEEGQENGGDLRDMDDFEVDFEVELNLGGGPDVQEDDVGPDRNQEDAAAPGPDIPLAARDGWRDLGEPPDDLAEAIERAAAAQAEQDAAQMGADNQQQQQQQNNGEHRVDLITTAHNLADTVFGALLFPLISEGSGELLRLLLPLSWTVAPRKGRWGVPTPTGLLQTKWGRSIVGGCMFVALKDAVMLYCRYRAAVAHRQRRVRDYDKKLGKLI